MVRQHFYRGLHNSSRCSSSPNWSSSTFIDDSITPADVPSVLPGSPALYIEDSIIPDDVPAVLTGSPAHGIIDDSTTPVDVPAVQTGPPALL